MEDIYANIGETAGKIYRALESEGEQTSAKLQKKIGVSDSTLFQQALGWLAREGKLQLSKTGKILKISLAEVSANY